MLVINDSSVISLSLDSLEGTAIQVKNTGLADITPTIHVVVEDKAGADIPITTAFIYTSITASGGGSAAPSGAVLEWLPGLMIPDQVETLDFDLSLVDASLFTDTFTVEATNQTADDDADNDVGTRSFNVIHCNDVLACGAAGNGIFDASNDGLNVMVSSAVLTGTLNFTGAQMQFGSYGTGANTGIATFGLSVTATGLIVEETIAAVLTTANVTNFYIDDPAAGVGGVSVGGLYALAPFNIYGLAHGSVKVRIV